MFYKKIIMDQTNGGLDVFRHLIPEFGEEGKLFLSPLRQEKNPSANIFRARSGIYLFKDFAIGKALDCIGYLMERERIDYASAVVQIINTFNLKVKKMNQEQIIQELEISGSPIKYFNDYCPVERIGEYLEGYDIFNIGSYTHNGRTYAGTDESPIIGFKLAKNCYKLYQPKNERAKHMWHGAENKPADYKNIWGVDQLPKHCDTILITEGLKDAFVTNVNLNHHGIYAVGVDSVSTVIPDTIIKELRSKCKNLVVCYDIDTAGIAGAIKIAKKHSLQVCTLPAALKTSEGKDISDWFKASLDVNELINAIHNAQLIKEETDESGMDEELLQILETERKLLEYCSSPAKPEPLILRGESPAIIKGTINTIVGREGSHKSHLAESIASLLLSEQTESDSDMGFRRNDNEPYMVLYVDTERNTQSELPEAMRNIGNRSIMTNGSEFHPFTLKEYIRSKRLGILKRYLEHKRSVTDKHMVVFLDVVTDCVDNFNEVEESMDLIDKLGKMVEDNNSTFIVVIHLNPNGAKATGHVGTQLVNKASTSIHISHKKGVITLEFKKTRHSKSIEDMPLKFDERTLGLMQLSEKEMVKHGQTKEQKNELFIKALLKSMPDCDTPYEQQEVIQQLEDKLKLSKNTIKGRIKDLSSNRIELDDFTKLEIEEAKGKPTLYKRVLSSTEDMLNFKKDN